MASEIFFLLKSFRSVLRKGGNLKRFSTARLMVRTATISFVWNLIKNDEIILSLNFVTLVVANLNFEVRIFNFVYLRDGVFWEGKERYVFVVSGVV